MTATILSIVAALLPALLEAWAAYKERDQHYAAKQDLRRSVVDGDSLAVSSAIDQLREKAARRRIGR